VAIRDSKIIWQSLSEPLLKKGCYPNYSASPTYIDNLWNNFLDCALDVSIKNSTKIGSWFNTFDNYNLGNRYFEETYFSVPVMNTILVLLTADEKDI